MLSHIEGFLYRCTAVRTGLRCAVRVDAPEERASLPAHPFQQIEKVTKRRINTILAKHSSIQSYCVEVFGKDRLCLITELMRRFEMEVFAGVRNVMVQSSDFDLSFFPVGRTLLSSSRSPLEQFQLPVLRLEKLWAFNKAAIGHGCKSFQSEINSDRPSVEGDIGNGYVRLNRNNHIPLCSTRFRQ